MAGYNRIVMVGNLTRDPEKKQLPSGQAVCRLGLACNRQFKNRQSGDMVQEVCYIDVDVWGAQAESCANFLAKGRQVLIEGRIKLDQWQDAQGGQRSKHSIVADRVIFLHTNSAEDGSEKESSDESSQPMSPRNEVERGLMDHLDSLKKRASAESIPVAKKIIKKEGLKESSFDEFSFKDEPPFQDDLPF